jgi:hypothetical protein
VLAVAGIASAHLLGGCRAAGGSPAVPSEFAVSYGAKSYLFTWKPVPGASHYELEEDPDGDAAAPYTAVGGRITAAEYAHRLHGVLLIDRLNARYRVRACNASACSGWSAAFAPDVGRAIGALDNGGDDVDGFGSTVALSSDGITLAIGAPDAQRAASAGSRETAAGVPNSGAVHIFVRDPAAAGWVRQALLFAPTGGARFGAALALAGDGHTLAVGAPLHPNKGGAAGNVGAVYSDRKSTL